MPHFTFPCPQQYGDGMGRGGGFRGGRGGGPGGFNQGPGRGGMGGYNDGFQDQTTFAVPADKCGLVIGKGRLLIFIFLFN